MNPQANYNASATLVILVCIAFCYVQLYWARYLIKQHGLSCWQIRKILDIEVARILIGGAICSFWFGYGSLIWWPTFPMLIAGDTMAAQKYTDVVSNLAALSNWGTVLGFAVAFWPAIIRWTSYVIGDLPLWIKATAATVFIVVSSISVWFASAIANLWVATFFGRPSIFPLNM